MTEVVIDEDKLGNVEGKVAIVTGGASGIGAAIVSLLVARGSIVVFGDVSVSEREELAAKLGSNAKFIECDVTNWESLSSFFSQAKEQHGQVDLVFANAGIVNKTDVFADDLNDNGSLKQPEMPIVDVNLISVIWTAKLALYHFKSNSPPGGSLVISASSSSYNARPNIPLYSVTKHGVLGLMRALREIGPSTGVSVSCIAPGGTASGMVTPAIQASMRAQGITVQTPDYVAQAAVMLASNKEWNGKSLALLGFHTTEVEGPLADLMPQWYGQYHTEMAKKAASVAVK